MYPKPNYPKTWIKLENTQDGETIENKVTRLIQNKEPIKDGSPIIFTDRKEGVNPAYNIRTDRFEIATEAMDRLTKTKRAKRDEITKGTKEAKIIEMKDGKAEPTGGKAENGS